MEVPEEAPSRFELYFLLVNDLNHIGVTSMKEAMAYGIKEKLVDAFELGFRAANIGIKLLSSASRKWL